MRQVSHRKPPFYSSSAKRISYQLFSIAPFADGLHEQESIRLKDFALYSGQERVLGTEALNPTDELQTSKNRS